MVDFERYTGRPRIDSTGGVMLGIRLIKAAPSHRSHRLSHALTQVRTDTVKVQEVRQERSRLRPPNLRPYDATFDAGWGGLYEMLTGLARFEGTDEGTRAAQLLARLFADGVAFLTASYESEWLHGQTLLKRVDDEALAEEITALTSSVALPFIRDAQKGLGDALGVGDQDVEHASTTALAEALDALSQAIADYTRILAGETDTEDPESVKRFLDAVEPLESQPRLLRAAAPRREPGRGEPGRGEPGRGEPGRGEPGRGEPGRGERHRRPGAGGRGRPERADPAGRGRAGHVLNTVAGYATSPSGLQITTR